MGSNPAALTSLMPGANIGGSSVAVPPVPYTSYGSNSIGGGTNPFLPVPATGQSVTPMTQPSTSSPTTGTPPVTPTTGATAGLGGQNPYNLLGGSNYPGGLTNALRQTGLPGDIANLLAGFLQSGAGFNPQVAEALINAMGPSIERGTENISEQFSAMGNRFGSPAAIGLGDFQSQVNLNIGEIFSQLYEQSVTDYLGVLMGAGKKAPSFGSTFTQTFAGSLGSGLGNLITG